jgi:hypothetical protein
MSLGEENGRKIGFLLSVIVGTRVMPAIEPFMHDTERNRIQEIKGRSFRKSA